MNLSATLHTLTGTATVIGFVVMFAWVVLIVWICSIVVGELRFNRLLHRTQRQSDEASSSYRDPETPRTRRRDPYEHDDGYDDRFHTVVMPIDFRFHPREDELLTEETGAVFDLSERYPNEFA